MSGIGHAVAIAGVLRTSFTLVHTFLENVLILFLHLCLGQLSSLPSSSDGRAQRDRHRSAERDAVAATMSGLNAAGYGPGKPGIRAWTGDLTPTRRADGPSACPCDSSCGSGGMASADFPISDAASRKVHSRAERWRGAAFEARFGLSDQAGPPSVCRTACGMPACKAGAAGAVNRQVFRTPSWAKEGERREKATGHPEPELKRGDDACLGPWLTRGHNLNPHPEEVCVARRATQAVSKGEAP
jgi:hypothetical protein